MWKEVGGTRTYFHYADEGLVGEYDSTGNEIKSYGYKPGSTWTTDPLFMKEGSSYYFYHNDHLGTPQKMTAVNGAVVWSSKYSSFGKATVEVETVENNLRFPGQYFDAETGIAYNKYRYYDSGIGRYLRADPLIDLLIADNNISIKNVILFKGGDTDLYVYVKNSPANFKDTMGLKECGPCEMKVYNDDKLIECLSNRGPIILIFGTACAVAILTPAPPIAKIPAIIGTCGITAYLIADCVNNSYDCVRIAGKEG